MRTGLGHLELGSGATYDGTFSKGLPNGVGVRREGGQAQVMRFPDSSRYEGEFLQGWFHGHGLFTTIDGMKYEGGENISLQAKFGDVIFDIMTWVYLQPIPGQSSGRGGSGATVSSPTLMEGSHPRS